MSSSVARTSVTTTKGPGTNSARLLQLAMGRDGTRQDLLEAQLNSGLDLPWAFAQVRSLGEGGLTQGGGLLGPAGTTLNDTTFTELGYSRYTSTVQGNAVLKGSLMFDATTTGVDLTSVQLKTNGGGGNGILGYLITTGINTAAAFVREGDLNVGAPVPGTTVYDLTTAITSIDILAVFAVAPGVDIWIEAKSNDDTSGTAAFRGGFIEFREIASDTLIT